MKLQYILFSTLIILFAAAFSAWGKPAPQSLSTHDGDDRRVTISGLDFGLVPELGLSHRTVESAAGLKSCVLLAEHQVLGHCKNLTVLMVREWSENSITTELRKPLATDPELMYLYIFDDEGGVSPGVGPINIWEGIPAGSSQLNLKEVPIEEFGSVTILELPVPDRPGKPGTPEVY